MKKLFARLTRPVPFLTVALSGLASVLIDPVGGCFLGLFPGIVLFCNLVFYLLDAVLRRLGGPVAVRDNLIQVYVDDPTYDRLHQMADACGIPLDTFCRICLECLDPMELDAVKAAHEWEADHG